MDSDKTNGAMTTPTFTFRITAKQREYLETLAKEQETKAANIVRQIIDEHISGSKESFCKELRSLILTDEETQALIKQIGRKIFDDCMREYERTIKEAINTSADKTLSSVSADDKQREDQALPVELS